MDTMNLTLRDLHESPNMKQTVVRSGTTLSEGFAATDATPSRSEHGQHSTAQHSAATHTVCMKDRRNTPLSPASRSPSAAQSPPASPSPQPPRRSAGGKDCRFPPLPGEGEGGDIGSKQREEERGDGSKDVSIHWSNCTHTHLSSLPAPKDEVHPAVQVSRNPGTLQCLSMLKDEVFGTRCPDR